MPVIPALRKLRWEDCVHGQPGVHCEMSQPTISFINNLENKRRNSETLS